jgi:hypothetical protein
MKFFYADSQDTVDPNFDFELESRSKDRLRNRHEVYAHELFNDRPYDGLLVSRGIVEGIGGGSRYTLAQRHRLYRLGAHEFFRVPRLESGGMPIMGDCGAFSYLNEKTPPFSVDDVIAFYLDCRFDLGLSVDHVITAYNPSWDLNGPPAEVAERQNITLELADTFLGVHRRNRLPFEPVGVAQGWSPTSYAYAVERLQKMGYDYIALGGMVPLRTEGILASLGSILEVRRPETRLHLLGVTRTDHIETFARFGVVSFDTTSPLRQAFKDDTDNYYSLDGAYTAIRIPQVEANVKLMKEIRAGRVSQDRARALERSCLDGMAQYHAGTLDLEPLVERLCEYEALFDARKNHQDAYVRTLRDRPWSTCPCDVCQALGYQVILFRGSNRNRRRGFHNLWVFRRRLNRALKMDETTFEPVRTNR